MIEAASFSGEWLDLCGQAEVMEGISEVGRCGRVIVAVVTEVAAVRGASPSLPPKI